MKTTMREQESKDLEQLFIRELSRDNFKPHQKLTLPLITGRLYTSEEVENPNFGSNSKQEEAKNPPKQVQNVADIVKNLCINISQDSNILYFLIFVAGVERNEELTQMVRESSDNFEGYDHPELIDNDPYEIVTKDSNVLDKSLQHALSIKSLVLLEYILNGADKCFINASMDDNQVLKIIENLDDPVYQGILKFI